MKVFLLHPDRDFDRERPLPGNEETLRQDLELDTLLGAMADGDELLFEIARRVLLSSLTDADAITYRQRILRDCLDHPELVRQIYVLAVEAVRAERSVYMGIFRDSPESILRRSVKVLELLVDTLRQLRRIADEHAREFASDGFRRFFGSLFEELDDAYFGTIQDHLERLKFKDGELISARLGRANKGVDHILRTPSITKRRWTDLLSLGRDRSAYTFRIPDRDDNGFRALGELKARGINLVANALAQSTDHIASFFGVLCWELGFYVACLNLSDRLAAKAEPLGFPTPAATGTQALTARGLYDVCLSLSVEARVVGNDVAADGKSLVMITGANQGGKSTFLRSLGLAQLMMQCGLFVAAESLDASACNGVFTHYKREEDATMRSGKLDEELSRMSDIADHIGPGCVLLCNESFASTNEREGSQIARQIVRALLQSDVRVMFVTHLYDLAHGLHREAAEDFLFLRAERTPDGERTFRLIEGEPLPTSYGRDLYDRIFEYGAGHRTTMTGQ